jgi:tRNA dimethylallyltransferase
VSLDTRSLFIPQPLKEKISFPTKKPKILVLAGPTCVGKTRHSVLIAQAIGGEIISADSMQVYRGMDIGTAKATERDRALVQHHLLDICELHERFNVMSFYQKATEAIQEILHRGNVPIVVGGTGFYIHALLYGPPQGPPSEPEVRKNLEMEMSQMGSEVLYSRLKELDPDYARQITGNDRHKIIRALEIMALTSQKVSDFPKAKIATDEYDFRCWFLYLPREILYPAIEMRCDEMIAAGLIDEVRRLLERGLKENPAAATAVGYRQCIEFLESGQSAEDFDAFVAAFKRACRNYAKRQFTWFRKQEPLFRWLDIQHLSLEQAVEIMIQDFER